MEIEKKLLELKLSVVKNGIKKKIYPKVEIDTYEKIKYGIREKKEVLKEKVLSYIKEKGELSSLDLYKEFSGINQRAVRRITTELLESGLIIRELKNHNKAWYKVIS
jgi:adenosylmethionine-8-amino-7-oxononanoate aminotransferase